MHERTGELCCQPAIDGLQEPPIQPRRIQPGSVLLHADDGPGSPELILRIKVAAVPERNALPGGDRNLPEQLGHLLKEPLGVLRFVEQIEYALAVAAQ